MVTGLTQIERVRLHYSICSLRSAGQLAECRVGVNDPRQSASANFRGRAVRVSPRISRILADLRPQADASAVRTSLNMIKNRVIYSMLLVQE